MRPDAVLGVSAALSAAWLVAMVAAPFSLPPDTVRGLDGHANRMDYPTLWKELPPWIGIVYAFGDLVCHQMEGRSWTLNGNQMPIDVRMAMAFVGSTVALVAAVGRSNAERVSYGFLDILRATTLVPSRSRAGLSFALAALAIAPAVIDGALQTATSYESTTLMRSWTGLLLGFGAAALFAATMRFLLSPLPVLSTSRVGAQAEAPPQP